MYISIGLNVASAAVAFTGILLYAVQMVTGGNEANQGSFKVSKEIPVLFTEEDQKVGGGRGGICMCAPCGCF